MVIEESITVHADLNRVWDVFTDLTRWKHWNSALTSVSAAMDRITQGKRVSVKVRLFPIPVRFEARIVEIVPREKVVWSGSKYGISSRHEFLFNAGGQCSRYKPRNILGITVAHRPTHIPCGNGAGIDHINAE